MCIHFVHKSAIQGRVFLDHESSWVSDFKLLAIKKKKKFSGGDLITETFYFKGLFRRQSAFAEVNKYSTSQYIHHKAFLRGRVL